MIARLCNWLIARIEPLRDRQPATPRMSLRRKALNRVLNRLRVWESHAEQRARFRATGHYLPPISPQRFADAPSVELSKALCDCPGDEGSCAELPNCRFKPKGK